jgi:hypothetical protein
MGENPKAEIRRSKEIRNPNAEEERFAGTRDFFVCKRAELRDPIWLPRLSLALRLQPGVPAGTRKLKPFETVSIWRDDQYTALKRRC